MSQTVQAPPEWGTKHAAGCYYGSGLYAVWFAVRGCSEEHAPAKDRDKTPGRGFDADGIAWCERACPRCGWAEEPRHLHSLEIQGEGCFSGAWGDILIALENPDDAGHRYRVARMIRMSEHRSGPPYDCVVLNCPGFRNWREKSWACDEHTDAPLCTECHLPTEAAELSANGQCPGCAFLKDDG